MHSRLAQIGASLALAALGGCAVLLEPMRSNLESSAPEVRECARWYQALDDAIDAAGVRDAQETRIAAFPYLRVDRATSALRRNAAGSAAAFSEFVDRLATLDLGARRHEVANLGVQDRDGAVERARSCGQRLRGADFAREVVREELLERATVPDDYSDARRVAGLYALTRLPFAAGVRRWEQETLEAFGRDPSSTPEAPLVRYAPPDAGAGASAQSDATRLLAKYAPIFEVETRGAYDRAGRLRWAEGSEFPVVDAADPVVYTLITHTLYRGRELTQLVYTLWFPERPPQVAGDLLAGRLDGLSWRVTLAPDGAPLIYDSIHPCGCYHEFFPTLRARPRPAPDDLQEWAFVPQAAPKLAPQERIQIRLASGTHYIERVSAARAVDGAERYRFAPYDELRSLPLPAGGFRSAFGPDGLIAGTERAERFFFWPMGIVSPGAMRQWGRHATAFIGRRHFDDADLFEKRFEFALE